MKSEPMMNNNDPRPRAYSGRVQWCFELMKGSSHESRDRIGEYRKRAIFVVHGIGSHRRDTTAVFLREGFENALDNLHKKAGDDPSFENLPSTYIKEGYWGDYGDFEQCFADLWQKMSDSSRNYFSKLWKTRNESVITTAWWFAKQAFRLGIKPHKFGGNIVIVAFRCLIFLVIVPLAWVALLILLAVPKCHRFITHYLGDVRLYMDPKGPIEHAIVQRIEQKVRDDFLYLLGVDSEFDPLPVPNSWADMVDSGLRRLRIGKEVHCFDEVTWVAHSLGTVVSYNVISELLSKCQRIRNSLGFEQNKNLREKVDRVERGLGRFYTLGSPLHMIKVLYPQVLKDWPEDYVKQLSFHRERTWEWVNFRHNCDPISGCLVDFPGAKDCHTKLSWALPGWAHIRYWHTDSICEYILARAQPWIPDGKSVPRPNQREWWKGISLILLIFWAFYKLRYLVL